jgi:hypothetical protein
MGLFVRMTVRVTVVGMIMLINSINKEILTRLVFMELSRLRY